MHAKIQPGEMPKPRYLTPNFAVDRRDEASRLLRPQHPEKWIGMYALAPSGEENIFLWFNNIVGQDLRNNDGRKVLAGFIARIGCQYEVEAAIGPAVDLARSNPTTEEVAIVDDDDKWGLFIEQGERPGFNIKWGIDGLQSVNACRIEQPDQCEGIFRNALDVLPRVT